MHLIYIHRLPPRMFAFLRARSRSLAAHAPCGALLLLVTTPPHTGFGDTMALVWECPGRARVPLHARIVYKQCALRCGQDAASGQVLAFAHHTRRLALQ
jgi:hypothetical protein